LASNAQPGEIELALADAMQQLHASDRTAAWLKTWR
jgi:hypothetical protein